MKTTAARRIARTLNRWRKIAPGDGKCVFAADGTGGAWYSAGAYGFPTEYIVIPVPWERITGAEVQAILDDRAV